jgi:hypothetical protein
VDDVLVQKRPRSAQCRALKLLKYKKSRPHIDVERGWSGANEHFPQQNSNIDYRVYLYMIRPYLILVLYVVYYYSVGGCARSLRSNHVPHLDVDDFS